MVAMRTTSAAACAVALALAGCSVVAPPPLVVAHAPAQPNPEGTLVVSLVGGLAGGIFVDDGLGAELRAGYQLTDRLELGAGLGVGRARRTRAARARDAEEERGACERRKAARRDQPGFRLFDFDCEREVADAPDWMAAVRGFGRFTPQLDHPWYAATFGAGAGVADNGLRYLTVDAGLRVSSGGGTVDVYAQPTLALSIPLARGRPIHGQPPPRTTFFWGATAGLIGFADDRFGGSLDFALLRGDSADDDAALLFASGGASYRAAD
jgi:hypothetical protein